MTAAVEGSGPKHRPDGVAGTVAAGIVVIVLFFGAMLGWAANAMLAGAVIVPGVVKVISDRQPIKHQESGIVAEVAVTEGQEVVADQLLLRLDATQIRALIEQLTGQVDKLRAELARLTAERDGLAEIAFPDSLLARAAEPRVQPLLAAEQGQFASRRNALIGEQNLLRQSIRQMEEQIAGRAAEVKSQERQLHLILQEAQDVRFLLDKGYAPKNKLLALERAAAALEGQRSALLAGIAETEKSMEQARMRIAQLERDRMAEVNDQLSQTQATLRDTEPRLRAAARQLELTEIRAPLAGRVMALTVRAPGRVIQPTDVLMEIVPNAQSLVVEGMIRPEDVDDIAVGMAAEVKLTGLNPRLTPRLPAQVTNISADRMTDARSGAAFYQVQLAVDDAALGEATRTLGHRVSMLPGMPTQITIATRERTVLEYLISPLTDGLDRALREP
ncbi:MAG TPA: HlyD family type I secretion periplasmic adaptor subunit [Azospirillum sp.]|nr:HlyD family type I secretion periplasmic adaptor subunit [Azospirillum sp.]